MDEKTLQTLEYYKILERVAGYAGFPASAEKVRALRPAVILEEARRRQAETSEAVQLLVVQADLTIGGARDVRELVGLAQRGGVLTPTDLLDVKSTLVAARTLARTFERLEDQYPRLFEIVSQLPPPMGLINSITRAISERGEILELQLPKNFHRFAGTCRLPAINSSASSNAWFPILKTHPCCRRL